ncbi:MAG: ParA family protein [Hyphomicrobiaceae bacterium]
MALHIAVANRKGGVGKSTVSIMLAHAYAAWGGKRVLVVDLDTQCNASLILLGGDGWLKAKNRAITIADYFFDLYDGAMPSTKDFVVPGAGDIDAAPGRPLPISLLVGSLLVEDVQGELFVREARQSSDPETVGNRVRGKLKRLLTRFDPHADVVIYDCAPGLSFAALAALDAADLVLVPFRPDYVSQFAIDRISMLIEDRFHIDSVRAIPLDQRRYVTLPNFIRPSGPDRMLMQEVAAGHPMLGVEMPLNDDIARAFEWQGERQSIEEKYGSGVGAVRALYDAFSTAAERARERRGRE